MDVNVPTRHVIQNGETLSSISQKYGFSESEIRNFHNQNAPLKDLIGTTDNFTNNGQLTYILIPPKEETSDVDSYEATQADETAKESTQENQSSEEQTEEQQDEPSKGQASEHDQKYVVIQKGYCVCDQSVPPNMVPVQFKVDSHKLQHANGDTAEHLIVTEEDVFFQKQAQPFGSQCLKQPNGPNYLPCSYTPAGKWQKTYSKIQVEEKAVLTELSELQCSFLGKITVFQHGQTQKVTNAHFGNVEEEELWAISPIAAKPELETPKVKSIKAKTAESKAENSSSTKSKPIGKNEKLDNRADGVAELTVKLGEQVQFEVKDWYNPTKANKSLTSWEVLHSGNESPDWNDTVLMKYEEFGSTLQRDFDSLGNFRVYAYGNEETKRDNRCAIDVNVVINELKGIKAAGDNVSGGLIRKGFPVNFQPDFKFTPSQEELQRVEMGVKDNAGNIVDSQFSSETGLVFTPENAIKYNVWIRYTNDLGEIKSDSKTFEAKPNVVDAIQASPAQAVYRPGSTITFTVSKMRFSPLDDDPDYSKIKWKVGNVTSPTTGKTLTHTFNEEGTKVVEAFMNAADGKGDDSYKVTISRNKVKTIKGGNTVNWIVGKWYTVEVETLMPFDPDKGDKLTWKSELPGHFEIKEAIGNKVQIRAIKTILAPLPGITANMGDSVAMLMVGANLAEIKRWCITDRDLDFKSDAGWGEELYAIVETSPILAGEKIHLHLLENDKMGSDYIKDLGEVEFDEKGIAKAKFTTDGIKGELDKLYFERGKYSLFFAAEFKEGSIQYADVSRKNRGGKDTVYPATTVSHSELEKGKFTYIDSKKDITSVRFLKPNGKDAYEVIKYGESITLKVQTRNLEGTKLKLTILRNKFGNGLDKFPQNTQVTVKDEKAEWTINTTTLKNEIKKEDWTKVAFWQVEIEEAYGDKVNYPKENARLKNGEIDWTKLMTYQSLKLSDNAVISELAKTNAPLVVGVPLEPTQHTHEDGKCPRCEEEITEEQIKKVYGGATDENLIKEITKALNKHRNKLGLDTCARKAHFFAQSREEAGSTLEPGVIGESFNYYKYNLVKVPLKAFETEEGKRIAETYGRQNVASTPAVSEANQIILANFAYGSQHTTGKNFKNSGNDGWNFRGRGLLQITGRSNYKDIQEKIDRLVPNSGVEVYKRFDSPNRAISRADGKMLAEEAVLTGMVEWVHKGMHIIADQTGIESDNDVLNKIIDKLNKYTTSREERHKHFQKTKHIFRVDECNKLKSSKEDNGKWRFPIDNPMLCLYSEGGYEKPWHGSFGENIRDNVSNHAGVDLLAEPGTPIYACFNGVIQRVYTSTSLAGRTIVVKVTDKETFNSLKRDYDPIYKNKGEIISKGFDSNKDVFLVFMHLSKIGEYKDGDIVKYNDVIGYTGVSGKNGVNFSTYNPHLHFEINNVGSQSGINGKCNPMVYFNFKTENEMTENDKKIQLEIKNKGNIW
ncbi:PAAR-like protein [Moheibacter stercoris]|uniref:Chitinase/plastocyanin n=1 Tax=Moheibacter stercoris TaxID=1628251 RepID=A0ABV2LPH4_9FLAO